MQKDVLYSFYKTLRIFIVFAVIILFTVVSCQKENSTSSKKYKTVNVIVVVIDGARYSETWGDTMHQNIPNMATKMFPEGVFFSSFFNLGPTYTNAGHTAITTGIYQQIDNSGLQYPEFPSFFQYYNRKNKSDTIGSWIITSKDKLEVLSNCNNFFWKDNFLPHTDCGISGIGSGYRHDSVTYNQLIHLLSIKHPRLVLVNFREPDFSGHTGNWENYLAGIRMTDEYVYHIWTFIQQDSLYRDCTSLFVTNDHGRHLDTVATGFVSHGDNCQGCRHISLLALGPDFKKGVVINKTRELIDIPVTISLLLHFNLDYSCGQKMFEMLE